MKKLKKNKLFVGLYKLTVFIILFLFSFNSCSKKDINPGPKITHNAGILDVLDSIYLYAQQIYLWNDQLPSFSKFNPSGFYSTKLEDKPLQIYTNEIFSFSKLAINPENGLPYEFRPDEPGKPKYSSVIINESNNEDSDDNLQNSYGLSYAVIGENDFRLALVDRNSPLGQAGFNRGDKIISINTKPVEATDSYYKYISRCLKAPFIDFVIKRANEIDKKEIRIFGLKYESNPVLMSKVFNTSSKKVGYISYNSFTNLENSVKYLNPPLYQFGLKKVTDLIIDMRYNGGGYQNTCIFLANNIIPGRLTGKVMFKEYYNSLMQRGEASILKNQLLIDSISLYDIDYSVAANTTYFQKKGIINNIQNIYFIVSNNTASASELLINVLRPYLNTHIIGVSNSPNENVRTYGKPVGFFDINISDITMYISMYQDKNARDEGDFFDGIPADTTVLDDLSTDFGSSEDPAIKLILKKSNSFIEKKNKGHVQRSMTSGFHRKLFLNQKKIFPGLIKSLDDLKVRK